MIRYRLYKTIILTALVLVLATTAFAMAAANTVPNTYAGDGAGTISGYTVSNIQYTLNATNPANIDSVGFTLDAAASVVQVKLVAAGSTYYSCTNPSGFNWTCTTAGATVLSADELRVIATE